jgi:hypothetical protein
MKRAPVFLGLLSCLVVGSAQGPAPQGPAVVTPKINLTMEQRHVIKESIKDLKLESAPAAGNVAVGDEVARTIQLRPLPSEISDRISQLKNYVFFVKGNQLIVVNPRDNKVVEIID